MPPQAALYGAGERSRFFSIYEAMSPGLSSNVTLSSPAVARRTRGSFSIFISPKQTLTLVPWAWDSTRGAAADQA